MKRLIFFGLFSVGALILWGVACASTPKPEQPAFADNMTLLSVQGYDVSYLKSGEGPVILLLHGGGAWSYTWRHNLEDLAETHTVIAVDMYGHGGTRKHADAQGLAYTLEGTSQFLKSFLDQLGIEKASLVGNSWGGGWALAFAQRFPERTNKLVLIGSSGIPGRERLEWEAMKWPIIGRLTTAMINRGNTADGLRAATAKPGAVTDMDIDAAWWALSFREVRTAQRRFMAGLDWSETQDAAADTKADTLIIWGREDAYTPVQRGAALCQALPNARFLLVGNAGHVTQEDQPQVVNTAIIDFLSGGQVGADCPD